MAYFTYLLFFLITNVTDRNKAAGKDWAFKVMCQKDSKHSRQKAHCWTSDNYDDELLANELQDDKTDESDDNEVDNIPNKVGPKRYF